MKLIALRSFRNVGEKIKVENALHPLHVEKGQTFEIGAAPTLQQLRKSDRESAELAAALIMARVATEPTPETVAKVQTEIEADRKREARHAELDSAAAVKALGAQWLEFVAQAARTQKLSFAESR
jgi:hypothetical protein